MNEIKNNFFAIIVAVDWNYEFLSEKLRQRMIMFYKIKLINRHTKKFRDFILK